jgi:murein DD-endopeptidase MepM/ murein hydrolase activator NlpD
LPFLLAIVGLATVYVGLTRVAPKLSAFAWPLQSNVIRGGIQNHAFGMVRNGGTRAHQGWDLLAMPGTPVYAVGNGVIESVSNHSEYGHTVLLRLENAPYWVFYAHLERSVVTIGARVKARSVIGYTGMTGNARGLAPSEAHLHIELRTSPNPGIGLSGHVDLAELYGFTPYIPVYGP